MNMMKSKDNLKMKPTVQIKDAVIVGGRLHGIPINHPDQKLNGLPAMTSTIVEYVPNTYHPDEPKRPEVVETRNTIYEVLNWD